MNRRRQSSRHLTWVVAMLATLAVFSFQSGAFEPAPHHAGPTRTIVVVNADDDPWDDSAFDDDVQDDSTAALSQAIRRPENAQPEPDSVRAPRPAPGTGPDVAVSQVEPPSGAALLTLLGVSLT